MQPKLSLLIMVLCTVAINCCCQETENTKIYEIRNSVTVYPCYITGKKMYVGDEFSTPPLGAKFMVVRPLNANGDTLIIRYLKWTKEKDSGVRKYYNDPIFVPGWDSIKPVNDSLGKTDTVPVRKKGITWPAGANATGTGGITGDTNARNIPADNTDYKNKIDRFFLIQRYDLDSNCIKVYNKGIRSAAFTVGLVTMPVKLRLGSNFDFQGNLSLGSTAGVKIRLSRFSSNYVNFLLGTSISTISLDSFSTKGKLTGQPLTNIAVFSPSLGAVFEFGKAQAGVFLGWDILNKSTQSQYEWIYNKKPWLSIGFGFSILNIDSKSNNSQSQNQ